jgi:Protein of unknown function (DUF3303)
MKYVVSITFRLNSSAADNEATTRRLLDLYSKWTPPAGTTFHQFVSRLDGAGGFAVLETDSAAEIMETTSKFAPLIEYQIYPVVDVADGVRAAQEAVEYRESIS